MRTCPCFLFSTSESHWHLSDSISKNQDLCTFHCLLIFLAFCGEYHSLELKTSGSANLWKNDRCSCHSKSGISNSRTKRMGRSRSRRRNYFVTKLIVIQKTRRQTFRTELQEPTMKLQGRASIWKRANFASRIGQVSCGACRCAPGITNKSFSSFSKMEFSTFLTRSKQLLHSSPWTTLNSVSFRASSQHSGKKIPIRWLRGTPCENYRTLQPVSMRVFVWAQAPWSDRRVNFPTMKYFIKAGLFRKKWVQWPILQSKFATIH